MSTQKIALDNEILCGVVGSTAHGIAIEGTDDRDEMQIFVEDPDNVCGLSPIDHYIYRDAAEGERSKPGDLDLTCYSLRKFCRLAVKGNPHVLTLLWLPEYLKKEDPIAQMLLEIREEFISRNAGNAYLGYLHSQKMKLKGEKAHTVKRPELIGRYGFDTKFASHALRLGMQGIELLKNNHLSLPMQHENRHFLIDVRTGRYSLEYVLGCIDGLENALKKEFNNCTKEVNLDKINQFLVRAHQYYWAW